MEMSDQFHVPAALASRKRNVIGLSSLPNGLSLSVSPVKTLYGVLISPMRTTCLVNLTLLDLIILLILVKGINFEISSRKYLWSCASCYFFPLVSEHSPSYR